MFLILFCFVSLDVVLVGTKLFSILVPHFSKLLPDGTRAHALLLSVCIMVLCCCIFALRCIVVLCCVELRCDVM
jgi:Na+/melibiose symporter-like transporter